MRSDLIGRYIKIIDKNMNYYFNKKLEKYNIKSNQFQILHYLYNNEGISQNELGKELMLDKITVTKILKGLVKEEYIKKKEGQEDKRRKELYVTDKGYKLHGEIYNLMQEVTNILTKDFSLGEKQIVRELLIRMSKNIYEVAQNLK